MVKTSVKQKLSKSFWAVDFETLPLKLHYFLYFGAAGSVLPFLTVFTKSKLSLTDGQVASLFATYQLLSTFTKPSIGLIVDYFNKLKLVIIVLTVLMGSIPPILLAVPGIDNDRHVKGVVTSSKASQSAFTLQCNFDDAIVVCHLVQRHCFKNKQVKPLNRSVAQLELGTFSVDDSRCVNTEEFKFCNANEGFVPHSAALNFFECARVLEPHDLNETTCVHFTKAAEEKNGSLTTFLLSEAELYPGKYKALDKFSDVLKICSSVSSSKMTIEDGSDLILVSSQYLGNEYFKCHVNYLEYPDCNIFVGLVETLDKLSTTGHENNTSTDKISPYLTFQFWTFALLLFCFRTSCNALFSLSDTACYERLQKTGADYGRQRAWSSVGWGLMAAVAGYLNRIAAEYSRLPDYSPGFFICTGFCILIIINISCVDLVKPDMPKSAWKDMKVLFKNAEFVIFAVGVFFSGVFASAIWFYLMVFLENIGGDKLLMGLVQASESVLGSIPFMFFSGWILKKLGHMNAMLLVFGFYLLRFSYYYMLTDPWWILPVGFTDGVTHSVFFATLSSFAKISAPTGTEATTQSLLNCITVGLGAGLGCIAIGISFDVFGGRETYLGLAICAFAVAVLQCLAVLYLKSRMKTVDINSKGSSINTIT